MSIRRSLAFGSLLLALAARGEEAQVRPEVRGLDPRSQRPWIFSLEGGWNSLSGLGVTITRHLAPALSLEAGLGISLDGPKVGVRARYNFSRGEWTPFAGAGFLYATGLAGTQEKPSFRYTIGRSRFLQLVAGVERQSWAGLVFCAAAGYARLLESNLTVLSGDPSPADSSSARLTTGSGLVLSVSVGRAF
jgi:hypothetical protein